MDAALSELTERVRAARAQRVALWVRAGGTKDFYGNVPHGEPFDPRACCGIVDYEPSELVVTARCGTLLADLEAELAASGQMLAFEPPHFGPDATVGGCIAAGLSGPRRATAGAVRDFVLGATLLDGQGRLLRFGGTVMKNVAGYDVARLLAGSLGTLGLVVQASLKVLPLPAEQSTMQLEADQAEALAWMNAWAGRPLPISATGWHAGRLTVRLSGSAPAVRAARESIGGNLLEPGEAVQIWQGMREQTAPFFQGAAPLWRLSVPSSAPSFTGPGDQMIEWGGALRWLRTTEPAAVVRAAAAAVGGHATLFRGGDRSAGVFAPLAPALADIHRRLKARFDPDGIFNRGRMFEEL